MKRLLFNHSVEITVGVQNLMCASQNVKATLTMLIVWAINMMRPERPAGLIGQGLVKSGEFWRTTVRGRAISQTRELARTSRHLI